MQKNIIFYDGYCALCHFWVKYVMARVRNDAFLFSPLQGEEIKKRLSADIISDLPDSIVVLDTSGNLLTKSDAVTFIFKQLGGINSYLGTLIGIFPKWLRDFCYDVVARFRKKIFGDKVEVCPILSAEQRRKFLD